VRGSSGELRPVTKTREVKATPSRTITNTDPEAQPSVNLAKRLVELTRLLQQRIHAKRIDEKAKFIREDDVLAVLE
jgi:hypothetical protein